MDGLIMAGQLILGLSILVILHELGHFLAARAFGIKVEKFYLFFDAWGVKLFKFNYKGCEYGIGWLPLGGYVKIAGMIDESMDTEQMEGPIQPWEFRSKPRWQRLIVMLGGIFVNIVLGIFIFWMLVFKNGESFIQNDKLTQGINPGPVATEVGFLPGDRIVAIDGEKVVRFEELLGSRVLMGGADLTVERDGETTHIAIPIDILNKVADHAGTPFVSPRIAVLGIDSVVSGGVADVAGIKSGDKILAIDGQQIVYRDQLFSALESNTRDSVRIDVDRNGTAHSFAVMIPEDAIIGIFLKLDFDLPFEKINYSLLGSLPVGASKAWGMLVDNAKGVGKIFTGDVNPRKALAGPVGIAQMFGAEVDWTRFWSLVGLLSMALALMNLLPIPGLDGGHTLFLLIEMVIGRPLNEKFMENAQMVGFFILVALMIFVFGNDIFKIIAK